ncbi:hypothetical protein NDU88_008921 [Pleurodeles waltl]|uniref:Uncharacterized protein n=1 Tax=Pleurodeles waltl TaxID=8319 RepID=A0AAV7PUD4_PLEWA|nr:hypothetical protein NDU88_008921 [Pleurodeles waltl]
MSLRDVNDDETTRARSRVAEARVLTRIQRDPSLYNRPDSLVADAWRAKVRYHPYCPRVETHPLSPKQTQAKSKEVNDKVSRGRRARTRDIRIGDQVIVKDRKPGWKFRTPYEPGLWTVTRVSRTMVTAEKGSDQVTRNISWFKKATFGEISGDQEVEDQFPDYSATESPEQDRESELPLAAGPSGLRQPVSSAPATQRGEARSQTGRYYLSPNPPPSQKLKDYGGHSDLRGRRKPPA